MEKTSNWQSVKFRIAVSPRFSSYHKRRCLLASNDRPCAQSDLAEIVHYAAQHNSDAAVRFGFELIARAESLINISKFGCNLPEFRQSDLGEIIYRSCRMTALLPFLKAGYKGLEPL